MSAVREVRVLEGPNADVAGPAVRLTLLLPADQSESVAETVRRVAGEHGRPLQREQITTRRFGDQGLVVAWPETSRVRGVAVARAVVAALGLGDPPPDRYVNADPEYGDEMVLIDPPVPTVAISGTNGKTTTTRIIAHCARTAGLTTAWTSTDGIYVDGELVDPGDWSGPGGARRVLAVPGLDFAVLETARGGLLQRGMSVSRVDVAVVTNIGADHLGTHGIDTVADLAWVKATVVRIVRPDGWAVLNADDPLVAGMGAQTDGRVWFFGFDESVPEVAAHLAAGGRATVVRDGRVVVVGDMGLDLGAVGAMPVTVRGLARFNLANALAAATAALAAGLPAEAVARGLQTFRPNGRDCSGRFNCWRVAGVIVVFDLAHNEESLQAVLTTSRALTGDGGRLLVGFGTAGDRQDEVLLGMGRVAAQLADVGCPTDKPAYLRGRTREQMRAVFAAGMRDAGGEPSAYFDSEMAALVGLLRQAAPGDVVVITIAEQLALMQEELRHRDGVEIDPSQWI